MRFMTIVKSSEASLGLPSPELMTAIADLSEEMFRTGKMLDTGGLLPISEGVNIRLKGDVLTMTDGPFTEAKEIIGGYAILNVDSKEEAVELGRRFMEVHIGHMDPNVELTLEVRQMYDGPPDASASPAERGNAAAHICAPESEATIN